MKKKKKTATKTSTQASKPTDLQYNFQSKKIRGNCDQDRAWIILEKVLRFVKVAKLIIWNKILDNIFHLSNFQRKGVVRWNARFV